MRKPSIKIPGETIYLAGLNINHAAKEYCAWLNDKEVNQYLETRSTSVNELKDYIKNKNNDKNCLFLGIFYKKNNKHIGNIKLEPIDFKSRKAILGIMIGDKNYWGLGIGTEATRLIVNYAFNKLHLEEVNLGVISLNKPAINVYKKVGFEIIGVEKKSILHGRKHFDRIVMSIKKKKLN